MSDMKVRRHKCLGVKMAGMKIQSGCACPEHDINWAVISTRGFGGQLISGISFCPYCGQGLDMR